MSRHGRDDDGACCCVRLQSPETRLNASRFLSSARYSDGKRSTNIMSSMGTNGTTSCTNLFTPVLHTLFTLDLTLLSVEEEQPEEGGKHP
jgi:hypothetical protein